MGESHSCQRFGHGEDLISGLPDELLHAILVRLRSARAAARTSVLSRRWRHVWEHLPELLLGNPDAPRRPPASVPDAIDAALGAYSAPTLQRLHITLRDNGGPPVPARRAAPWLRFASQRVVGELHLHVPSWLSSSSLLAPPDVEGQAAELELPVCARAKTVTLTLQGSWQLRPQLDGLFNALTSLSINSGRMEASELTALVSKRCPCLRDLRLQIGLLSFSDVSVLSDSLHSLWFFVPHTRRLEVMAPMLEKLSVCETTEARFCCPKLAEVVWLGDTYNHRNLKFDNVGRRLRLLEISQRSVTLMRQFEVDELKLEVRIPWEIEGYMSFLNEANQLPRCEILRISVGWYCHSLSPCILHLLRSCNSTRKLSVLLHDCSEPLLANTCSFSCTCHLAESCRIDDIALSSLEEVEICNFESSNEQLKFVEQLSRCNAAVLKKLVINYTILLTTTPLTKEMCKKVHGMWRPSVKVEFYVFLFERRVRFNYTQDQ